MGHMHIEVLPYHDFTLEQLPRLNIRSHLKIVTALKNRKNINSSRT